MNTGKIAILVLVFIAALCVMMVLIQQQRTPATPTRPMEAFISSTSSPPRPMPMPSPASSSDPQMPKGPMAIASDFRTGYDDMLEFVPSPDAPDRKTFKVNTENPCDPYGTGTCFTRQ